MFNISYEDVICVYDSEYLYPLDLKSILSNDEIEILRVGYLNPYEALRYDYYQYDGRLNVCVCHNNLSSKNIADNWKPLYEQLFTYQPMLGWFGYLNDTGYTHGVYDPEWFILPVHLANETAWQVSFSSNLYHFKGNAIGDGYTKKAVSLVYIDSEANILFMVHYSRLVYIL